MLEVLPQPPPPSAGARLATALLAVLAAVSSAQSTPDGPSPGASSSSVLEPGQTIVKARYWNGTPALDPDLYTVDAGGSVTSADLLPSSALAAEMRAKFDSAGVVHVTNTGLSDMGLQRVRSMCCVKCVISSAASRRFSSHPSHRACFRSWRG